jgi:hypothetical protein
MMEAMRWALGVAIGAAACSGKPLATPTILTSGQVTSTNLAVDATSVYWIDFDPAAGASPAFAVMSVPKVGGAPTALYAATATRPGFAGFQLAVAGGRVIFTILQPSSIDQADHAAVMTVPITGGAPTTLYTGPANISIVALAADDTTAFWIEPDSQSIVRSVPLDGGTPIVLANFNVVALPNNNQLAQDATTLYLPITTGGSNGSVFALPKVHGTGFVKLADAPACCVRVAVAGGSIYWSQPQGDTFTIMSRAIAGGAPAVVTAWPVAEGDAYALALDATNVYWSAPSLWRAAITGGRRTELVTPHDANAAITVDGTDLYYADRGVNRLSIE